MHFFPLLALLLGISAHAFALDVERIKPSVVRVLVPGKTDELYCTGSGFVVQSSGDFSSWQKAVEGRVVFQMPEQ